ncbi:MAG: hypothetical protein PHU42_03755 [Patescibacteria group bacterium]|nr:hypothetical protein [Patescibacteria group bacterium]
MIDIDVSKIVSEIGEPKARLIENEDEARQKKYTLVFSFAFLFIFILGSIFFYFLSSREAKAVTVLNKDVSDLRQANNDLLATEKDALFIQRRNASLLKIIQSNPNWSYVLETMEEVVPKGITFSSFEVASSGDMRISGISPDYETLSKLAVSMSNFVVKEGDKENKVFGNVNVTNASLTNTDKAPRVDFAISFNFVKKINKEAVNPITSETPVTPQTPTPAPLPTPAPETNPAPTPTPETTPTPIPVPAPEQGNSGLPVL